MPIIDEIFPYNKMALGVNRVCRVSTCGYSSIAPSLFIHLSDMHGGNGHVKFNRPTSVSKHGGDVCHQYEDVCHQYEPVWVQR